MKVKAKWAIKVNGVWRRPGEVFETDSIAGLKGNVDVVSEEKKPDKAQEEDVRMPDTQEAESPVQEAVEEPKPKAATRTRKKTTK